MSNPEHVTSLPKNKGMIKEVPIEGEQQQHASASCLTANDVLNAIYEEHPEHFDPVKLNTSIYDGPDDKLFLIRDKVSKGLAGFVGLQKRELSYNDNNPAYYISIGVLPEYRGRGIAKHNVLKAIKSFTSKDDDLLWTVNKGNDASIALYNSLVNSGEIPNKKFKLVIT